MGSPVLILTYDCCGIEWTETCRTWPPFALACPECAVLLEPVRVEDEVSRTEHGTVTDGTVTAAPLRPGRAA